MTWAAVAVVGASVAGSYISGRSADKASARASEASAAELEFQKQRYDDWKAVYGDVQTNLSNFYNNLSPDYFISQGIQNIEQEQAVAKQRITESLAARGISDSGVAGAVDIAQEFSGAQQRAEVRTNAPLQVANEKLRFLQVGLGSNPAESVANTLGRRTAQTQQQANYAEQAYGEALGNTITTAGTALADYYGGNQK